MNQYVYAYILDSKQLTFDFVLEVLKITPVITFSLVISVSSYIGRLELFLFSFFFQSIY